MTPFTKPAHTLHIHLTLSSQLDKENIERIINELQKTSEQLMASTKHMVPDMTIMVTSCEDQSVHAFVTADERYAPAVMKHFMYPSLTKIFGEHIQHAVLNEYHDIPTDIYQEPPSTYNPSTNQPIVH